MEWMQKENETIMFCLEEQWTEAEKLNVREVEVKAPGEVVAYTWWHPPSPNPQAQHKHARKR